MGQMSHVSTDNTPGLSPIPFNARREALIIRPNLLLIIDPTFITMNTVTTGQLFISINTSWWSGKANNTRKCL